jgi:hypothetical protein
MSIHVGLGKSHPRGWIFRSRMRLVESLTEIFNPLGEISNPTWIDSRWIIFQMMSRHVWKSRMAFSHVQNLSYTSGNVRKISPSLLDCKYAWRQECALEKRIIEYISHKWLPLLITLCHTSLFLFSRQFFSTNSYPISMKIQATMDSDPNTANKYILSQQLPSLPLNWKEFYIFYLFLPLIVSHFLPSGYRNISG